MGKFFQLAEDFSEDFGRTMKISVHYVAKTIMGFVMCQSWKATDVKLSEN